MSEAVDMSDFWRLVSARQGRVRGVWWVSPRRRGGFHVSSVEATLFDDDERTSGRNCSDQIRATVEDGEVTSLRVHPDRVAEADECMDDLRAVIVAAAHAVQWLGEQA